MKCIVTLSNAEYLLLITVLKKAKKSGIIDCDACNLVLSNTDFDFNEVEK